MDSGSLYHRTSTHDLHCYSQRKRETLKDHTDGFLASPGSAVHHFHPFPVVRDLITWPNIKEAGKWSFPVCPEKRIGMVDI